MMNARARSKKAKYKIQETKLRMNSESMIAFYQKAKIFCDKANEIPNVRAVFSKKYMSTCYISIIETLEDKTTAHGVYQIYAFNPLSLKEALVTMLAPLTYETTKKLIPLVFELFEQKMD